MQLREIFNKKIDRDIKGVIKIGQSDEENVLQELDEYVVTSELSKYFSTFFDSYRKGINTRTDKMGVWISGFFGSGKSHFLKILSYLLQNKEINGTKAVSFFDHKIEDSIILANMKAAGDITTDVILFNIDAKSDSDSKVNKDAIVKVFMKVFNEMQGFCSSMPWIADLERQMFKDGTYDGFKAKFEEVSGKEWIDAREDFYFEEDNIVRALAQTTKMSEEAARSWYNKSEESYSLSIEKFAKRVREYIETKGKTHHVVFLCDEIGQYIGDDINLMLNLQTVVENLGMECGGQAWVIATSQQDIDAITKVKRNDFSKILGRFDTRLSLSSANVDEVIKKRILAKTQVASDTLKLLYCDKNAILKNLITFSADTPEKKLYKSEQDFVDVYPFIPYQFNLLQAVFTGIRLHGASGKHLSEGERSLLSAFQESALQYAGFELGTLIPFQAFYRTIEAFLDHNIKTVIMQAENNDRLYPDDIDVLKVLFMIKYIANVLPANLENIATMMVSHVDEDKIELKKKIDASLRRLASEALIQKNGDQFVFLTNEEQDVSREILNIHIDSSEIIDKIGDIIFAEVYIDKKYRYNARYDFAFNASIDDRPRGAQKEEIGLKVITPYFSQGDLSEQSLKMLAYRENSVVIKLPSNVTFIEEMEQALQIETYIRRNSGKISTEIIEDIKTSKSREARVRKERSKELVIEGLKQAELYANNNKLDIKEKHPAERINDALKVLVESIYTKQGYITQFCDTSNELRNILLANNIQVTIDGTDNRPNKLALEELSGSIQRSTSRNIPVTMKGLLDLYGKSPYGWKENDIAGLVLTLFKSQEIRMELGGEYLDMDDSNIINYVTKRDYIDRVLIKMRVQVSPDLINNAKNLIKVVFGTTVMPNDEDGIMAKFKELSRGELNENIDSIKDLLPEYSKRRYPGKSILETGKKLFEDIIRIKETKEFYEHLKQMKDSLLDYEEDVQDVKKFFKNQKPIFDRAIDMLNIYEGNRSYVLDADTISVVNAIDAIIKSPTPYGDVQKLPELIDQFRTKFSALIITERKPIKQIIESDRAKVTAELGKYNLYDELGVRYDNQFKALLDRLEHANNIYETIAMKTESDRLKLRCIDEIIVKATPTPTPPTPPKPGDAPAPPPAPVMKTVTLSASNIFTGTQTISSKEDIDKLLNELRAKLERQLGENTVIKIV